MQNIFFALLYSSIYGLSFTACATSPIPTDLSTAFPAEKSPAQFVSEEFLESHLRVLAHDTLKGRGTGQMGSRLTADYLYDFYSTDSFTSAGFEVQRQPFSLEGIFWDTVEYTVSKTEEDDTLYLSRSKLTPGGYAELYPVLGGTELIDAPVVFAGFGNSSVSYQNIDPDHPDYENAWLMVFEDNYQTDQDNQQRQSGQLTGRTEFVQYLLGRTGAAGILFISEDNAEQWEKKARTMSYQLERPLAIRKEGHFRSGQFSRASAASIHPGLAAQLLGLNQTEQLDSLRQVWTEPPGAGEPVITGYQLRNLPNKERRSFVEENILAIIPGSDPQLSDEVIVLTAHYDHMGLGEPDDNDDIVYNGADDNASGTSSLLQIADAFRRAVEQGYRPSRTILFLHVAAEEWGLLGSRYFVRNPVFPKESIAVNVNVDMVGHIDNEYANETDTDYVYIIGAGLISSGLQDMLKQANRASVNFILDEKYNSTTHPFGLYRRSDHWAFGEHNIPFVFFFSGLHDNYHVPSDTVDRIAWFLLSDRTKLVTELVWRLAESSERPVADQQRFTNSQ